MASSLARDVLKPSGMNSQEMALNSMVATPNAGAGVGGLIAKACAVSSKADGSVAATPSDVTLNRAIGDHAGGARDWLYSDLHRDLSMWASRFNERFFGGALPPAAISLDSDNIRTLGTYRLSRDGLALNYRINVNTKHLTDRGDADVLETLCHEQVHEWEHVNGRTRGGRYHTKAFRKKAEDIGIPAGRNGCSIGPTADGPFARLLAEHGVSLHIPPAPVPQVPVARPRSTISPWVCSCTRVWVAAQTTLMATCGKCGGQFARAGSRTVGGG